MTTIIAVCVGWFLGEMSGVMRGRSKRRTAIARAISELLEIRHTLIVFPALMESFSERVGVPEKDLLQMTHWLSNSLGDSGNLKKRFNAAVDLISQTEPLLAYRLRGKGSANEWLQSVRGLTFSQPDGHVQWQQIWPVASQAIRKELDSVLVILARRHSITDWWKVRKIVSKPIEPSPKVENLVDQLAEMAKGEPWKTES